MGEDKKCICDEKHQKHLCQLRCKGKIKEVERQTRFPNVACSYCGENANLEDNVCEPVPLFV